MNQIFKSKKSIVNHLIIIVFTIIYLGACKSDNANKIDIIFRMDDFYASSNTKIEQQIFQIFDSLNIKLTVSVIPFESYKQSYLVDDVDTNLGREKEKLLKYAIDSMTVEPALHGYNHVAADYSTPWLSEFYGIDYQEQNNRISLALEYLERIVGRKINVFTPPWNSYDQNTLKVLHEKNIKIISAAPHEKSFNCKDLSFIPYTCELYNLESAIQKIHKSNLKDNALIVVLFHPYDFEKTQGKTPRIDINEFRDMLVKLNKDSKINIYSFEEYFEMHKELTSKRLDYNRKVYKLSEYIHPLFNEDFHYRYYNNTFDNKLQFVVFRLILYYLGIVVVSILLSRMISAIYEKIILFLRKQNPKVRIKLIRNVFVSIYIAFAVILCVYVLWDLDINYRGLSVIVASVSTSPALVYYVLFRQARKLSE